MPPVTENDPRPPYVQIADELRTAILAGKLKPGERLDSGRTLAKRYGVAPMTVHNALSVLREEGLLASWQGLGVFVADPLPSRSQDVSPAEIVSKLDALSAEVAELRRRVAVLEERRVE
jgi:DNA-binding GntR family transcriptional regulator